MLEVPQTRPGSSMSGWIKKHSPLMPDKETEAIIQKLSHEYDIDCPDASQEVSTNSLHALLNLISRPLKENKLELDLQSAGSSPNLTYTKISALDAIRIL